MRNRWIKRIGMVFLFGLTVLAGCWVLSKQALTRQARLDQALIEALYRNDKGTAHMLLDQGASPNARDDRLPPVHWNSWRGLQQAFRYRQHIAELPDRGRPALMLAAARWDGDLLQLLLDRGANPNAIAERESGMGYTTLIWLLQQGKMKTVQQLLDRGADINGRDMWGATPLMWAARSGQPSRVQFLLVRGADIAAKDRYGHTALSTARMLKFPKVVQLLAKAGAKE